MLILKHCLQGYTYLLKERDLKVQQYTPSDGTAAANWPTYFLEQGKKPLRGLGQTNIMTRILMCGVSCAVNANAPKLSS